MINFILDNPCAYSFDDLLSAAGSDKTKEDLYKLSQEQLNQQVKILCKKAGWFYKDIIEDNILYTSFSPKIKYC